MKKSIQLGLILMFAATLLLSCSKDNKIKKQMVGTWTITEVVTIVIENGGTPDTNTDTGETETIFKKDGTGTASSSGSGTNPFPAGFTWSISDEVLIVSDPFNTNSTHYTVIEHSDEQMILNATYTITDGPDTWDYDVTITMNMN